MSDRHQVAAREFNVERDAHIIGALVARAAVTSASSKDEAARLEGLKGEIQRHVAEYVVERKGDTIRSDRSDAHWLQAKLHSVVSLADLDRLGLHDIQPQSNGDLTIRGIAVRNSFPSFVFGPEEIVRYYAEGCAVEKLKRDGSFRRCDDKGRVHCDAAPAVRDRDGNEFWFEHGRKLQMGHDKSKGIIAGLCDFIMKR